MSESPEHTDAQLVAGVLAGDREAFAAVYDRHADRLHDFCWSVLRDPDEAADAVGDTFVLLAQRLAQLDDPDGLRPWLYAVARSVVLRRVRARRRVVLDETADRADADPGPDQAAERAALRELVWRAAAGLSARDRALLDLHVRHGLDGAELGVALGVSASHAHVLLSRLRDQVERSLGALLIARQGRADCAELDAVASGWDGRNPPLLRKRVARHVDGCAVCADRRRTMVSPFALLAAVPLLPAPPRVRDQVIDRVQLAAHHGPPPDSSDSPHSPDSPVSLAAGPDPSRRQRMRVAAAAAAVLALLIAGGALVSLRESPLPGEPLGLDVPTGSTTPALTGTYGSDRAPSSLPATTTDPTTTSTTPDAEFADPATITTTKDQPPDPPDPPDPPRDRTPPVVSGASASAPHIFPASCAQVPHTSDISATVTDNVGVESVTLSWSGPGSGSRPMPPGGVPLGPFGDAGVLTWTITAADAAGNTSSADGTIEVLPCDGGESG